MVNQFIWPNYVVLSNLRRYRFQILPKQNYQQYQDPPFELMGQL